MDRNNSSTLVREFTDIHINECYQCGKCTAGCPVAERMDLRPSVIMRMLQSGDEASYEEILRSNSIWLCLSCETCYSRCPMELDIPKVIDYLRTRSFAEGKVHSGANHIVAFHQAFLHDIKRNGRLHEVGLILSYKLRTRAFFQDISLAPEMYSKGKLHLLPERIKNRKGLSRLFRGQLRGEKS